MYPYFPRALQNLYDDCLWRRSDLDNQRKVVTDPTGQTHYFHSRRLVMQTDAVVRLLRVLSPEMMRSRGDVGMPWFSASYVHATHVRYDYEFARKLLAIGIAVGYVTLQRVHLSTVVETITYAIVEDLRWKRAKKARYKKVKKEKAK